MKNLNDIKQELTKIHTSKYYLAYIDILGAKDLINSNDSELYLNYVYMLYNAALDKIKHVFQEIDKIDIKIKIFSDNIIIAIPKENDIYSENEIKKQILIIDVAAFFQVLSYKYSFLTRGSILVGDLYFDENFVYGKALTKAYELESEVAIYPRLIIENKSLEIFKMSNYINEFLYKDTDGIYYLNSFECYFKIAKTYKEKEIKHIKTILWSKLKASNSTKVNQKILWIINIYNKFCLNNNCEKYVLNTDKLPQLSKILNDMQNIIDDIKQN